MGTINYSEDVTMDTDTVNLKTVAPDAYNDVLRALKEHDPVVQISVPLREVERIGWQVLSERLHGE